MMPLFTPRRSCHASLKTSWRKSSTALFSLQPNVRSVPAPLSIFSAELFFLSRTCRNCYIIHCLQERSQGNQLNHALKCFSASSCPCHSALCQTELLFSLNNLTDESPRHPPTLALYSSVTNTYALGGLSLHHLTTLSVRE